MIDRSPTTILCLPMGGGARAAGRLRASTSTCVAPLLPGAFLWWGGGVVVLARAPPWSSSGAARGRPPTGKEESRTTTTIIGGRRAGCLWSCGGGWCGRACWWARGRCVSTKNSARANVVGGWWSCWY